MIYRVLFFVALLISALPQGFAADADPVIISAAVDRAKVTTGDNLTFTVTLKIKDNTNVDIPELGEGIGGFRILDFGKEGPAKEDQWNVVRRWYKLRADVAGSYILPAIEVKYGEKKFKTSEIFVEVESVVKKDGEGAQDIRDIKPIIKSPFRLSRLGWAILIMVLAVLAAGVYFWRRAKNVRPIPPVVVPPHLLAYQKLYELEKSQYLAEGKHKIFHFTLSEILRAYIEAMFHFTATDMTIEEVRSHIKNLGALNDELKNEFIYVLSKTDVVKFTDLILPIEESLGLLNKAKNIVNLTKPKEVVMAREESVV